MFDWLRGVALLSDLGRMGPMEGAISSLPSAIQPAQLAGTTFVTSRKASELLVQDRRLCAKWCKVALERFQEEGGRGHIVQATEGSFQRSTCRLNHVALLLVFQPN